LLYSIKFLLNELRVLLTFIETLQYIAIKGKVNFAVSPTSAETEAVEPNSSRR